MILCLNALEDLFQSWQQGIADDLGIALRIMGTADEAQHHTQVVGQFSATGKFVLSIEFFQLYQEHGARLTFTTKLKADIRVTKSLKIESRSEYLLDMRDIMQLDEVDIILKGLYGIRGLLFQLPEAIRSD